MSAMTSRSSSITAFCRTRKIDDLMAGARVGVGETKEDPLDFAL